MVTGWMYGTLNGDVGYFPSEYVRNLARFEVDEAQRITVERIPSFKVGTESKCSNY